MDSLFWFRKGEFRGIIFIVLLAVLWLGIEQAYDHYSEVGPLSSQNRERLLSLLDQSPNEFAFAMEKSEESVAKVKEQNQHSTEYKSKPQEYVSRGEFNPIQVSDKEWLRRGLSKKQLRTFRNFQFKGGSFLKANDFDKLYGWNSAWLKEAKREMVFEESTENFEKTDLENVNKEPSFETKVRLDLNTADSSSLVDLKGIGPFYATQIIKYRNQLGGFVEEAQLMEVYKMREENFNNLMEQARLGSEIECLLVSSILVEELASHPYISWVQARGMVSFRELHGHFRTIDDVKSTRLFSEEELVKLKPYLCFNDRN